MKPGMGKVFKQIQDAQRNAAEAVDPVPRVSSRRRAQPR
jgi:hypothetical protein